MATETEFYRDISGGFDPNPTTGDLMLIRGESAIANAIRNLIFLNRNSKFFQPNVFCGIENDLFEPLTPITADIIKRKIERVIENYEPRVEDVSVTVSPDRGENGYKVRVQYLPRKAIDPIQVNFFLERAN